MNDIPRARGSDATRVFYAELGARVRRARGQRAQQSIAEAVGLSRASIANVEAGRQPVSSYMLVQLAAALGVTGPDLLPPTEEDAGSGMKLDLRGLDAAERRFVVAVSRAMPEEDDDSGGG